MDNLPKTWDDWIANFNDWQDRVGFDREWLGDFDLSIQFDCCLLYTSPSPRDAHESRMPSSA